MRPRTWLFLGIGIALLGWLVTAWWMQLRRDEALARLPAMPAAAAEYPPQWHQRVRMAREALGKNPADSEALRELARLFLANRQLNEARQCYALLADTTPKPTARDRYHRAHLAGELGDTSAAISELNQVLLEQPVYLPARVLLGLSRLKSNDPAGAAQEFEAVLAAEPLHIDATVSLARLDLQAGDSEAAQRRLELLVAKRPEATSALALLAQVLERRGDARRAAALRQRSQQRPDPLAADPWMAELDPYIHDVSLLGLRFEEHAQAGDETRARFFLGRIEEFDPKGALSPLLQGSVAARARRHAEAVAHFRAALARGADPEKVCPVLASALVESGQSDAALSLLAEYSGNQPDSLPLLVAYSEMLVKRKERPEARAVLTRTLQIQPFLVPQSMALAEILWGRAEYDAAEPYLRRVAQTDTRHVASRALLAELSLRRADPAAALAWLEQAVAIGVADAEIRQQLKSLRVAGHMLRAHQARQKGDPQTALPDMDKALALAPEMPQVHAERAQLLVQMGETEAAAQSLERLAGLQPDNPTVWLSLGDLRRQQGRTEEASRHWQIARRLADPKDERLRRALEQRLAGASSAARSP